MCFLLLLTISLSLSGSERQLASTQVPRFASNIWHCWSREMSKAFSIASEVKILRLVPCACANCLGNANDVQGYYCIQ